MVRVKIRVRVRVRVRVGLRVRVTDRCLIKSRALRAYYALFTSRGGGGGEREG